MKKILSLLVLSFTFFFSNAQIVITEIMYNPPESGTDTTEFIELFNITGDNINLNNYTFTAGIELVFGDVTIGAGEYLVITKNSSAFFNYYGSQAIEWTDGSLSNGGEDLILTNAAGDAVDIVSFDDEGNWPGEPDGNGYSLELCDVFKDNNDPANWKPSITETQIVIEGATIFASPGLANEIMCEDLIDHTIDVLSLQFDPKNLTIHVNETVQWINGLGGNHNINGSLGVYPDNPEGFYSGAPNNDIWVFTHTFTLPGLYKYKCDLYGSFGMRGTIEVLSAEEGNLVITEIMYNDPSDNDSLEFVELFNNGDAPINLENFKLQSNQIDFTFPESSIEPGDFMILCYDSDAIFDHFGFEALNWGNGLLNNNHDVIMLLGSDGGIIDEVEYDDDQPWPSLPDGFGHSLNLCRPELDNAVAENWQECPLSSGTYINGFEIFANPGGPSYCNYDVGDITQIDEQGVILYNDLGVELIGTVHGVNLRPGTLQITLIDEKNDGVALYSSDSNYGYEVNEGDKIIVLGKTGQYNGLTQIYLDTVLFFGQQLPLSDAQIVTELSEETESQLVTVKNVQLVDDSDWGSGSSGFNVEVTDGTNNYMVRIDNDVDLFAENYPTGTFDVTGLGGQFDSSSPFFDGYELLPRYIEDISPFIPNEYFPRTIGEITNVDQNGVADSLDIKCLIEGIVYGINLSTNGLNFTLIDDNNDGINIYSTLNDIGYEVEEGDRLKIKGKVTQYNGLTEFTPTEIQQISSGNMLVDPLDVTELGEDTESNLVKIAFLSLIDETEWKGDGNSFNVHVSNGTNEFEIRIDNDCELSSMEAPSGVFHATGIGGQFDTSEPYTSGYQLFPRYADDIDLANSTDKGSIDDRIELYPNPVKDILTFHAGSLIDEIEIYSLYGQKQMTLAETDIDTIDVSTLPNGVYAIVLKGKSGTVIKRFTKTE